MPKRRRAGWSQLLTWRNERGFGSGTTNFSNLSNCDQFATFLEDILPLVLAVCLMRKRGDFVVCPAARRSQDPFAWSWSSAVNAVQLIWRRASQQLDIDLCFRPHGDGALVYRLSQTNNFSKSFAGAFVPLIALHSASFASTRVPARTRGHT
jgi:hypothetical protein